MIEVRRRAVRLLVTVVVFLAAWQVGAGLFGPAVVPPPLRVGARLVEVLVGGGPRDRGALYHLGRSLVRVVAVSVLGLLLSVSLGLAMGVDERVERVVAVWLPFWMTIPTLVVVLVVMVLLDFGEWAVVVGVTFVTTPFATANTWEGARAVDPALLEMARAFDVDRWTVVREVYLPATLPQIVGGFRYLLGMVWKVVVLAETFGLEDGLGAMFRFWFVQGDVTTVLAYLSLFVGVMVTVQYGIGAVSNHLFTWRA